MGRKILIDTNIAIGYIGNRLNDKFMDKLDNVFDTEYHISVINKIELLGFPNLDKNEEDKFNLLINHSILHPIDNKIIEETILIRKGHKIKLPDALIAATCLVNGLDILTLNTKDFENINGLKVIEPKTI
ncbi:MAG TPA: type II toxin-antitoxin system VapC family toxin [Prolixibacteraceae bacterium]|nr:type II toxin-antitoxin system VapC family toxin [Prolixibacteraceae bacterium]